MCIAHRLLHSTSEISDATASMPSPGYFALQHRVAPPRKAYSLTSSAFIAFGALYPFSLFKPVFRGSQMFVMIESLHLLCYSPYQQTLSYFIVSSSNVAFAVTVFFSFLFILTLFHTKTVLLLFGNSLRFIMPSDLSFTISSTLCAFEYIFINGTLQGLTL